MDKNNNSNSSVCTKIRQKLASNGAFRAIHRISSNHQEPKPATFGSTSTSSSPPPTNATPMQTKQHIPQQHVKANTEAPSSGAIPIKFAYSENAKTTTTKVAAKGEATQPTQHVPMQGKPPTKIIGQHGHGHHGVLHSEQQGKKSMDLNETFHEYIQRAKTKIRTVSNIGRGQNNPAPEEDHESRGATNKKEDHRDQFSEFIQRAKKKLRTTTIAGRSSSMRKE